jgi:hypothetical protein
MSKEENMKAASKRTGKEKGGSYESPVKEENR